MRTIYLRCFILLTALTVFPAQAKDSIRVIYTTDLLGPALSRFKSSDGTRITAEYYEQDDLKTASMGMVEQGQQPHAVIVPADHVGLHAFINYSTIEPQKFSPKIPQRIWERSISDGKLYGIPLIQGNHLVLYYNKRLTSAPAPSWKVMAEQKSALQEKGLGLIAWTYDEPYWFIPFLGAFGGWPITDNRISLDSKAMADALDFYKSLRTRHLPYPNCNQICGINLFKMGRVAYLINGEWDSKELYKSLGKNLGVAPIPSANGKKMVPTFSTQVIAFPNDSLNGPMKKQLRELADYLQDSATQKTVWQESGAIPVNEDAFKFAMKSATGYMKDILALMPHTNPLPADEAMSYIWDAIGKGFKRHQEGVLSGEDAARYMQKVAERHLRNAEKQKEILNQKQPTP